MIDFSVVLFISCVCGTFSIGLLVYGILLRFSQLRNSPPGAIDISLCGLIFCTDRKSKTLQKTFGRLCTKCGPIFHFYLGSQFAVVINDYKTMLSAFRGEERHFLARWRHPISQITRNEGKLYSPSKSVRWKGLLFASGTHWEITSFFTRTILNGYQHNTVFAELVQDGAQKVAKVLMERANQELPSFRAMLQNTVSTTLAEIFIGQDYANNYLKMRELSTFITCCSDENLPTGSFEGGCPLNCLRWNRKIIEQNLHVVNKGLHEEVQQQYIGQERLCERSFAACYLNQVATIMRFKGYIIDKLIFTENELVALLIDLMVAGTGPLVKLLYEGLAVLALNPDCQRKAQSEIDSVSSTQDQDQCQQSSGSSVFDRYPYMTAVCCEILRLVNVTKLGACRRTTSQFNLGNYRITKGTLLIANLHAIHREAKEWKDPEVFSPERYFTIENRLRIPPNLVPFSMGERACPGGYMAMYMLLVYLSVILNEFTVIEVGSTSVQSKTAHTDEDLYHDLRFVPRKLSCDHEKASACSCCSSLL